jgi:hypothetical protein
MKISKERLEELRVAIDAVGGITSGASMRNRWDQLWRSGFDTRKLYDDGLNDQHIDTALRAIAHD